MLKLKIDGLSCSIKSKEILKDITVSFQQGEMAAVLGRNGAGKRHLFAASRIDSSSRQHCSGRGRQEARSLFNCVFTAARKDNLFADDL